MPPASLPDTRAQSAKAASAIGRMPRYREAVLVISRQILVIAVPAIRQNPDAPAASRGSSRDATRLTRAGGATPIPRSATLGGGGQGYAHARPAQLLLTVSMIIFSRSREWRNNQSINLSRRLRNQVALSRFGDRNPQLSGGSYRRCEAPIV